MKANNHALNGLGQGHVSRCRISIIALYTRTPTVTTCFLPAILIPCNAFKGSSTASGT